MGRCFDPEGDAFSFRAEPWEVFVHKPAVPVCQTSIVGRAKKSAAAIGSINGPPVFGPRGAFGQNNPVPQIVGPRAIRRAVAPRRWETSRFQRLRGELRSRLGRRLGLPAAAATTICSAPRSAGTNSRN